ncbi:DUF5133 domain-containing protein [Actinacidiphila glaucinigra]|uniref:DUF5133 domain-containing protein n=1 Tax=Actinacidiphila glaucinigra TaxID=235986 RepID=UPI0033BBD0E4
MLTAHPAVLDDLVDRYQTLRLLNPDDAGVWRRLEDVAYSVCGDGASDGDAALIAARLRLSGAGPAEESALSA